MTVPQKNIQAIAEITDAVMHKGQFADKAFEAYFKQHRTLTASETGNIVSGVNHLIRNWRLLTEIQKKTGNSSQSEVLWTISQMIANKPSSIPSNIKLNKNRILEAYDELKSNTAVLYSIPDWLDDLGRNELASQWPSVLAALHNDAQLVIRANTIKCSKDQLHKNLALHGIKTKPHDKATDALIFNQKLNVFRLQEFKQGFFEMQDMASQLVGQFADPMPCMRVIDGCAGNGGKTLHLASLMQNKGRIIALDLFQGKLETLKCRAKRAGISVIETREISTTKVIKRLHESADLVLLDVPCSGLGVLRRNPEIKWRLQPADLDNLKKTQEDILNRYSLMAKPGGKVVYSTCSILPSENSQQIQKFLSLHNNKFDLIEEKTISPEEGFDGFYMASLLRKA